MSGLPSNPSKSFIARNPQIFGRMASGALKDVIEHEASKIRQPSIKLNKLETSYYEYLKRRPEYVWIGVQSITLRLADDCRYTPDFWTLDDQGEMFAHEVKGKHFWDDAKVKLKVAAALFPMFGFFLVMRDEFGWRHTIIKR